MQSHHSKISSARKLLKVVSVVLVLALAFAGFAAQYAHQHYVGACESAFASNEGADANSNSGQHGFSCQACQFSLTHVAPQLSVLILKPIKESFELCLQESNFHFVVFSTHYHLRAPPTFSLS
jgi:hypothetical protein